MPFVIKRLLCLCLIRGNHNFLQTFASFNELDKGGAGISIFRFQSNRRIFYSDLTVNHAYQQDLSFDLLRKLKITELLFDLLLRDAGYPFKYRLPLVKRTAGPKERPQTCGVSSNQL